MRLHATEIVLESELDNPNDFDGLVKSFIKTHSPRTMLYVSTTNKHRTLLSAPLKWEGRQHKGVGMVPAELYLESRRAKCQN